MSAQNSGETDRVLAAAGIHLTAADRRRGHAKIEAAAARMTPERRADRRARLRRHRGA